jgi:hypothetical protein
MEMTTFNVDELNRQGFSCSQVVVMMTMTQIGIEDENLVRAVRGLSLGMGIGHVCGIVTGAACALSLAHGQRGMSELFPEFYKWFDEKYGNSCGAIKCSEILDGDIDAKIRICPGMVTNSWNVIAELLEK